MKLIRSNTTIQYNTLRKDGSARILCVVNYLFLMEMDTFLIQYPSVVEFYTKPLRVSPKEQSKVSFRMLDKTFRSKIM